jgi:hypothetical protein
MGDSFICPMQNPGMERISPDLVQGEREVLIFYLVKIFRACVATGKVPGI